MEYKEAWAVDIARIERFFLSLEDTERENAETEDTVLIRCGACKVKLSPLPLHPVGPVKVPRTRVEISGPDDAAGALFRRFFLRFISAGG